MRLSLTARMLTASAALALVVAAAFAVMLLAIGDQRHSTERARHSEEVIAAANNLEKLVLDLETGQRGFVITGRETFLDPWKSARRAFPLQARSLDGLVSDNPAQEARARAIEQAGLDYLREYSDPLVAAARADQARAKSLVASGEGKRRVDAIRRGFDGFVAAERRLSDARRASANDAARRAIFFGAGGLLGSVLLVLLFAAYLARTIAVPVRRVAEAADRRAAGDLSARVPDGGKAEIGELAHAFNRMADSLQESRGELERQNAELELQTSELEAQQAELETANDELEAQQAELERTMADLADEKGRVEAFFQFGERLAAETELEALLPSVLTELADFAAAEVGLLYVLDEEKQTCVLAASRGIEPDRLPATLARGAGLPGRALEERRTVAASYGETGLRLSAFGEDVAVRQELDVPLCQGDRVLGVVGLGRAADRPFSSEEREAIEHLVGQAAVAVSNALAFRSARRLAGINSAVLNSATDAIAMVDAEGRTVLANTATERVGQLHGIVRRGTLRDSAAQIRERTTDPDAYWSWFETVVADPELETVCEYEMADNGVVFQAYTAPVRDPEGTLLGRVFTIRDVTAEREAEQLKSDLVATVSHELRTPLASILGFAELLVERDFDETSRVRYLETIYKEARRLTTLINDFLDLQRIEEGKFTLALEPFDLAELLRDQAALFSGQSAEHTLELDLADGSLAVLGEPERIAQVVGNLLSNGIKYSPAGGKVTVAATPHGGTIRVSVADAGLGIPADQQRRIFTKFFRVDTSDTREIGGTGLGLALCREIVEAHGGRIGFDSAEGEGSTFWFELPATHAQSANGRRRVLVIEDDPAAAALISEHLVSDGYAVELAATGEDGLARANENPPALVALDIGLPGELDGWQVLARLKASRTTAHVPVVICTAGNGRDEASALGASDFLVKPFSGRRLRETVARLLPSGTGSVLVVDDEESVRRLVVETLGGAGLELREAADGEEALAAVAARKPDAIVLDLMMPKLDGLAVLERLQGDPETRPIPVVVLTARHLSAEERSALKIRAVEVLEKSAYSAEELRRLINRALGRPEARAA